MTRRLPALIALTAIYFAAGKLGLQLAFVNESASAVWPPAGIAVGCLLQFGTSLWPAVMAGAFLVNLTTSHHVLSSASMAAGNTVEALLACWLLTRYAGGATVFSRANTAFRFAMLATVAATVAASVGTAAVILWDATPLAGAAIVWLTWWLGDTVGMLLFAPLVVMWASPARHAWTVARGLEMLAVIVTACVSSWIVFSLSPGGVRTYPTPFLPMPILLWPAFRLGARETVSVTLLLAVTSIVATLSGLGPFVRPTPNESLLFLQPFVGLWVVVMLAVSIEVERRERAEHVVRELNETLERRVVSRTEELSRMHARLAEAQRIANVGSWEWEVASNRIWWSDQLFRIFGKSQDDGLTYDGYLTLLHADDRAHVEGVIGKALADGRPFSLEHRVIRPDGIVRTIQGQGHVVTDQEGKPVRLVGTAHDITDRRRADEERLQRLREQAARIEAEDANRAKDEFLATLSHELRTPLNAALGWTQMLADVIDDPVRRGRAADAIRRNLQSQARLVSDMMDVSSMAMRTLRLEIDRVVLGDAVRSAIDSVREPATTRRIDIVVSVPDTPLLVRGDAMRLQQVIWNLVSNATKFSRDGGRVTVTLRQHEDTAMLTVEDDGPGIDAAFLPHLFERFRQADSSVTRAHGGLGLGLAIARHLVEAHGGTISAANRPDGGAAFTVVLPAELVVA